MERNDVGLKLSRNEMDLKHLLFDFDNEMYRKIFTTFKSQLTCPFRNLSCKVFLYLKKVYATTVFIDVKVYLSLDYGRTRQVIKHYGACVSYYIRNIWYILWILRLLPLVLNYWFPFMSRYNFYILKWAFLHSSLQWLFAGLLSSSSLTASRTLPSFFILTF